MQNNLVEEIPDLSSLPELTTLGLCNNNIRSVGDGLARCKKLNALNLSKNRLETLEAVQGLRSLTVTSLDLSESPELLSFAEFKKRYLKNFLHEHFLSQYRCKHDRRSSNFGRAQSDAPAVRRRGPVHSGALLVRVQVFGEFAARRPATLPFEVLNLRPPL